MNGIRENYDTKEVLNYSEEIKRRLATMFSGQRIDLGHGNEVYIPYTLEQSRLIVEDAVALIEALQLDAQAAKWERDAAIGHPPKICWYCKHLDKNKARCELEWPCEADQGYWEPCGPQMQNAPQVSQETGHNGEDK